MSQTPTTRHQLRSKESPGNLRRAKMQTRLSTGTLVMNGTSTVKEKDIRTPPGTPTPDTLKNAPIAGSKRQAAAVDTLASVKVRKTAKDDGQDKDNEGDPFCWQCHRDGVNVYCQLCPRSYHIKCLLLTATPKDWVCGECDKIMRAECRETQSKAMAQLSTDTLSLLLRYALDRMRQPGSEVFQKPVDSSDLPLYSDVVINPMDFSTLEKNIKKQVYGCTEAFLADAKWILHNCIVFNGVHHKLTGVARNVLKSCKHEMSEIEVCPQCYHHSCVKGESNWFLELCDPPHTLVWAKLKGYPFWPAKALQEVNGQVDVRFFGAHDMAWVPLSQVFLLSKDPPTCMKGKKGGGIRQAIDELKTHVDMIKEKYGLFDYAPHRTPYDRGHIYLKGVLKGVNLMAAKRFKVAAHGRLAAKGKEAERVSIASKTASALKTKYSTMASKKSTAAPASRQYLGHQQPHPDLVLAGSAACTETTEKAAQDSSAKDVNRVFFNPVVSVKDIIQHKLNRSVMQEEDGESQERTEAAMAGMREVRVTKYVGGWAEKVKEGGSERDVAGKDTSHSGKNAGEQKTGDEDSTGEKCVFAGSPEIITDSDSSSGGSSPKVLPADAPSLEESPLSRDNESSCSNTVSASSTPNHSTAASVSSSPGMATSTSSHPKHAVVQLAHSHELVLSGEESLTTKRANSAKGELPSTGTKVPEVIVLKPSSIARSGLDVCPTVVSTLSGEKLLSEKNGNASKVSSIIDRPVVPSVKLSSTDEGSSTVCRTATSVSSGKQVPTSTSTKFTNSNSVSICSTASKVNSESVPSTVSLSNSAVCGTSASVSSNEVQSSPLQSMKLSTSASGHSAAVDVVVTSVSKAKVCVGEAAKQANVSCKAATQHGLVSKLSEPESLPQKDAPQTGKSVPFSGPDPKARGNLTTTTVSLTTPASTPVSCDPVNPVVSIKASKSDAVSSQSVCSIESEQIDLCMEVETEAEHEETLIIDLDEDDLEMNEGDTISLQRSVSSSSMKTLAPSQAAQKDKQTNSSSSSNYVKEKSLAQQSPKLPNDSNKSSPSQPSQNQQTCPPSILRTALAERQGMTQKPKNSPGSEKKTHSESSSFQSSIPRSPSLSAWMVSSPEQCKMVISDVRSLSGQAHEWKEGDSRQSPATSPQLHPQRWTPSPSAAVQEAQPSHAFRMPPTPPVEQTSASSASPSTPRSTPGLPTGSRSDSNISQNNTGRPSEDSPQTLTPAAVSLVNKYSQQIVGNMQLQLADMCKELLSSVNNEAEVDERIQELKEQLQWTHEQQMAEVQHDHKMMIAEMKACWEVEKSKALGDMVKKLTAEKREAIAETKKKQWCADCWKEALYYCCWNTSYCSYVCQQRHWKLHQNVCRQVLDAAGDSAAAATVSTAASVVTIRNDSDTSGKSGDMDERMKVQAFNLKNPQVASAGSQDNTWQGRLPQNVQFVTAQQPLSVSSQTLQQQPALASQHIQPLQYIQSMGTAGPATFQANSQVQLLTQRPTLNTVLPSGAVVPGNAMVFPILRSNQSTSLAAPQNVVINRPLQYQSIWK